MQIERNTKGKLVFLCIFPLKKYPLWCVSKSKNGSRELIAVGLEQTGEEPERAAQNEGIAGAEGEEEPQGRLV